MSRYTLVPDEPTGKRYTLIEEPTGATPAEAVSDAGKQAVYGFNQGLFGLAQLPGNVMAGVAKMVGVPEETANRFRLDNPVTRTFTQQPKPETTAGRYANAIGQAAGASAVPTAGMVAAAPRLAAIQQPATAMQGVGQMIGQGYMAAPRATLAYEAASTTGSGIGQQAAQDAGFGPAGQVVGAMAGGIAPALVGSAVRPTVQAVQRARANVGEAGAYGQIASDLPAGVDDLANRIAVGGGTANMGQSRFALDVLGEEMVRANGNVAAAQQATVARIVAETGVTPTTARQQLRQLSGAHEGSPLFLGEYPAVAQADEALRGQLGGNRTPANIANDLDALQRTQNTTTQAKLDYLANNGNAQSAMNVRNAIDARQETLSPTMTATLEGVGPQIGGRPAGIIDAEQMIEQARQAGRGAYQAAYNGPIDNRVSLYFLPRMLDWHATRAAGRSGDARDAIMRAVDQFHITTPQGQRLNMSTLQQLQDARGVVRGQIEAYRRQGRNDLVNAVQPFYEHITRMMTAMSPQWAQANRQWADMNFLRMAEDLGEAFATKAGPQFRAQLREFQALAPEAQNIVRIQFLQKLFDKLDNLGDTHAVSKMFSNDHTRRMVREMFGDQAVITFTRAVRDQKVAEASQGMMRNSATHRRGMAQRQMDAETGLVSALDNASVKGVRNWMVERAAQIVTEHRNRPMGDILTTPVSDTAQVARHLYGLRQQETRLREINRPRQGRIPTTAASGAIGSENEERRGR